MVSWTCIPSGDWLNSETALYEPRPLARAYDYLFLFESCPLSLAPRAAISFLRPFTSGGRFENRSGNIVSLKFGQLASKDAMTISE